MSLEQCLLLFGIKCGCQYTLGMIAMHGHGMEVRIEKIKDISAFILCYYSPQK